MIPECRSKQCTAGASSSEPVEFHAEIDSTTVASIFMKIPN